MNARNSYDGFRTMTTRPNHARKLAAGVYQVDTPDGPAVIECIGDTWYITYPNRSMPDHFANTLQDAQRQVQTWTAARRPSEWSGRNRVAPDYDVRY